MLFIWIAVQIIFPCYIIIKFIYHFQMCWLLYPYLPLLRRWQLHNLLNHDWEVQGRILHTQHFILLFQESNIENLTFQKLKCVNCEIIGQYIMSNVFALMIFCTFFPCTADHALITCSTRCCKIIILKCIFRQLATRYAWSPTTHKLFSQGLTLFCDTFRLIFC